MRGALGEQGVREVARRRAIVIALALGVVALCFLQVPPLDSWRFHTVSVWRPVLSPASPTAESPPFSLDRPMPVRVSYAWDNASPAFTSAYSPGQAFVSNAGQDGGRGPLFVDRWWPTPFRVDPINHGGFNTAPLSGASGTLYMASPFHGSTTFGMRIDGMEEFPRLTVTLSEPYGYFYVPIEDYLIAAAILGCTAWYLLRYRRRRTGASVHA